MWRKNELLGANHRSLAHFTKKSRIRDRMVGGPISTYLIIHKRRVPYLEQELLVLQDHLSSPPVFSAVRVPLSLACSLCNVLYIVVCPFIWLCFGHCIVCSSSIYGFWLHLWYLQAFLRTGLEMKPFIHVSQYYENTLWMIFLS